MAKASTISAEHLLRFRSLAATVGAEVKGASMPYLSMNGNMFAFLSPDGGLHLRVAADVREAVIAKHTTALSTQHGAVLKEYVAIPESLWASKKQMHALMTSSHEYAATLRPKAKK